MEGTKALYSDLEAHAAHPFKKTRMDKTHFALLVSKWAGNNESTTR